MGNRTQLGARHIPRRTCVVCREPTAKRALIRIVRTPAGTVEVDETGKKAGRGAYLCRQRECWQEALRKDRLSRALRVKLWDTDKERLRVYAEELFQVTPTA